DHGRLAVLSLAGLYLTQIERRVGFHDKNVWSVLSDLHGAARHQHRIFERLQNQPHANELRWPQTAIVIVGCRPRSHRAHTRLHCVIDRSEERRVGKECRYWWWPEQKTAYEIS